MAQQDFNTSFPDDGLGDQLRDAFLKQQAMNTELYDTKVDKVAGKDLSDNNYDDTDKAKVDALTGDEEQNVQSDWNELDPTSDAFILGKPIFSTSEIIVSAIWTGTGLVFDVSADAFPINGVSYPATPAEVTLDPADGSLDRIDLIVAIKPTSPATVGTVGKITGTPASTALVVPPDYDPSLYYVIKPVRVNAAATTPEGAVNTDVYTDATTWTKTLTANLAENTSDPSEGVNCIEATNSLRSDYALFTSPIVLSSGDLDLITFDLKLKETLKGKWLAVRFYIGGVYIFARNFKATDNGFDDLNLSYQQISINKAGLNLPVFDYDGIQVQVMTDTLGYFLDNVKIYAGSGSEAAPETGIPDAPNDNKLYGRKNLSWEEIVSAAPIPTTYADLTALLAGQVSQLSNYIYEVTDGSGFTGITSGVLRVKYLGTTLGTEADYTWEPRDVGGGTVDVVSNVDTNTILGRITTGNGDSEELTPTQVRTLINVEDGATASSGTVTSVAVSGSDGIEVDSGSPITTSGTIALGLNAKNTKTFLKDRLLENATVTGSFDLDYSLYELWNLTLTGATTFTESNLEEKTILIRCTGNFALTFPTNWSTDISGTYDGTVQNIIVVQYFKSGVYKVQITQPS